MLRFLILIASLLFTPAYASPNVAVSLMPLHSIAVAIMRGAGEPVLVITEGASPHHASLRPSQRRAVANADIVFWVSPALEAFMPRLLESQGGQQHSVVLIEAPGVRTLPARHHHDSTEEHHAHATQDTHIWLSPDNAAAIATVMAETLSRRDPQNANLYRDNLTATLTRIDELDRLIREQLAGLSSPFITYHDAYQYFERHYGLNHAGSVTAFSDAQPGTRHVQAIRNRIAELGIACLFYDAPAPPALVAMLRSGTQLRSHELDPLGIRQPAGENAWFNIMQSLADAFSDCLRPANSR